MGIFRPRISTFFSLNGPILKNLNSKYFLLHRTSKTEFFDQLPLVSAGPHYHGPIQLFVTNLEREVS